MAEPERRRRRLRGSSSPGAAPVTPAETAETRPELKPEPSRPDPANTRPDPANTRPDPGNTRPDPGNTRPDPGNTRPDPANTRPDPGNTRRDPANTRPDSGAATERPAPARSAAGNGYGEESERGLRGLVGSGSSQVSVSAAMRARDAARPTEEQLADADQNLTVVRRNWTPREDLPRRG